MGLVEQKVVVITGAAQGIGLCAAERFAREGAIVSIWDFNEEKGIASAAKLREKGLEVSFQQVNVSDKNSVERATQAQAGFSRFQVPQPAKSCPSPQPTNFRFPS